MKQLTSRPAGHFDGRNFMTRDVVAYYELRHGLGFAELAQGEGISRQPIFGVTVEPNRALGKLFQSKRAALDYIEALS